MIRILVVNILSSGGGAETVLNNLKDAIGTDDRRLRVDSFSKGESDALHVGGSKLAGYLRFMREIRRRAAAYDFVVSGVEGVPFILCSAATLGMRRTRAILWLHCNTVGYLKFQGVRSRLLIRLSLRMAQRVICAAPAEGRRLIAGGKQAIFLPNILRRSAASAPVIARILPKLVFIGSLAPLKQPQKPIDVLTTLLHVDEREWRLDYFGSGPLAGAIERRIAANGLGAHVVLHGFVDAPWAQIDAGSILLLPSLTEAMPMVVLEAIARGCVVISNTFPGYEFFEAHGGLFLSAQYTDVGQVAALAVRAAAWSADEIRTRTENSRAFLAKDFDNAKSIGILHSFLTSLALAPRSDHDAPGGA